MDAKVLVVGTTPDYIYIIDSALGDGVLFLTDKKMREAAFEPPPLSSNEICSDLSDLNQAISDTQTHLKKFSISISGIACFDCESMELASQIGKYLNIPFQTSDSIKNCRNKFLSKEIWQNNGLYTPKRACLKSENEATSFFKTIQNSCVLKPLSGAGSELVYLCHTSEELKLRFNEIMSGLQERQDNRLFKTDTLTVLAEEFIKGTEYSCDFIVEDSSVQIIRLTEKIKINSLPFGIIAGYKLINQIPSITHDNLCLTLSKAATSIGINKSICMIDFIVEDGKIFLIEIAPRPGGDCLPSLLHKATKQSILIMNIEYAAKKKLVLPDYRTIENLMAFRIFASKEGLLKNIDTSELQKEKSVIEINITARIGQQIKLPPNDYDSWILGHFILNPVSPKTDTADLYSRLLRQVKIFIA